MGLEIFLGAAGLGALLGALARKESRRVLGVSGDGSLTGRDKAIDKMCDIAKDMEAAWLSNDLQEMENLKQAFNTHIPDAMIFGQGPLEWKTLFQTLRTRCPGYGGYFWSMIAPHYIRSQSRPSEPTTEGGRTPAGFVSPVATPTGRAIPPEVERMLPPPGFTTTTFPPTPTGEPLRLPVSTAYLPPRTYPLPETASVARAFQPIHGQLMTPEETRTESLRRHREWMRAAGMTPTQGAVPTAAAAPVQRAPAQAQCPPGTIKTAQGCMPQGAPIATASRFPGLQRLMPLVGGFGGGGIQAPSLGQLIPPTLPPLPPGPFMRRAARPSEVLSPPVMIPPTGSGMPSLRWSVPPGYARPQIQPPMEQRGGFPYEPVESEFQPVGPTGLAPAPGRTATPTTSRPPYRGLLPLALRAGMTSAIPFGLGGRPPGGPLRLLSGRRTMNLPGGGRTLHIG